MIFAAALGLEHRGVLRVLAGLHLLLAAVLATGLVVFGLDPLEVRRGSLGSPAAAAKGCRSSYRHPLA